MKKKKTDNEPFLKDENDTSKVNEVLFSIKKDYDSRIQSRQVAGWSAIIFYFPLLWYFNKLIFNENCEPIFNSLLARIIILFIPVILGYIFFRFIHANYQEVYLTDSIRKVIDKTIIEIIRKKNEYFKIKKIISSKQLIKKTIVKKANKKFDVIQSKRGKLFPLKIVKALFFNEIFYNKEYKLTNVERQEASLLSLLFFSTLLYEIYLLKILGIFKMLSILFMRVIDCF